MRCPRCEKDGLRSTVRVTNSSDGDVTSFHDGDGRFHSHVHELDPWIERTCSRGHVWRQMTRSGCEWPDCQFNEYMRAARGSAPVAASAV